MDIDISHTNLLDLRRSEKRRLYERLRVGGESDLKFLWERIEKTLSQFTLLLPENEEQIYFFGASMRNLMGDMFKETVLPLRQHASKEVDWVFAGGFLGLSMQETLESLQEKRRSEGELRRIEHKNIKTKAEQLSSRASGSLLEDMREAVASIVPARI